MAKAIGEGMINLVKQLHDELKSETGSMTVVVPNTGASWCWQP